MGRKYIPIELHTCQYKVYLPDIQKIYRLAKKTHPDIPKYSKKNCSRKESLETIPDTLTYYQSSELEL